jgi:hypothetical protein
MHSATRQQREDLGLAKLSPEVKQYITDLEVYAERLQNRSRAHRIQLKACNAKLETVNLRLKLAQLAGQAKATDTMSQVRRKKLQRAV